MASRPEFNSKTDGATVTKAFPESVRGKTFIITGVSPNGLGQSTAEALATQQPRRLILTGRAQDKVQAVIDVLRPKHPETIFQFLSLDLSSIKRVEQAAQEIMAASDIDTIDGVICNAGVMTIPECELSIDGIEMQFATNHIGHFLFVNLIMKKLIAAAEKSSVPGATRVIVVTSLAMYNSPVRFSDHNFTKAQGDLPIEERANFATLEAFHLPSEGIYNTYVAYGQSKTANCLYSLGLNRRLNGKANIRSYAVHPGVIFTELFRHSDRSFVESMSSTTASNGIEMKTKEQGCSTSLVAALDMLLAAPDADGHNIFLTNCQVQDPAPWAKNPDAADKLWELSESLVGRQFSW